jgi:hypothetical protein
MTWGWIVFAAFLVLSVFLLSKPKHLARHLPGVLWAVITGMLVEFGLRGTRQLWDGTHYLVRLGRIELTYLLYYGVQGLFFFQYLPRQTSMQIPYTILLAFGNSLTEQILALNSLHMIGTGGWQAFATAFAVHSLRLTALLGVYYAINHEQRAEKLKERESQARRRRLSLLIWQYIWPGMGLIALGWMKCLQRLSRS